jgi:hypothetical protein
VLTSDSPTITPELRLRAAIGLAAYQHPKPIPLRPESFVGPVDYISPKTAGEARQAVLDLGERLARREISAEAHALVSGIKVYLGAMR